MGQLADRLAVILAKYGADPAAHQSQLQALAALELADPKEALARFHALKREAAEHRRAGLLVELRATGRVVDVSAHDTRGMDAKEVEREIREFTRALAHARDLVASAEEAARFAERLGERRAPWAAERFARVPYAQLAQAATDAEGARRDLAREARVAARAHEVRERAKKLRLRAVSPPDVSAEVVPDARVAHELLDATEVQLTAAEAVEAAHEQVIRPLRDPAVARWKGNSRKALLEKARELVERPDSAEAKRGLDALAPEAETLRRESAAASEENTRARRKGRAAPARESRAGDTMDGYG